MVVNHSLLEFVKNMKMNANYQPIVIKMLLENENHSVRIMDIRKKFDELNFGRGNFISSEGKPMGNTAIDSVKGPLKNYASFDGGVVAGNARLREEKYDETYKDECLKICGQEIMKWHLTDRELQKILKDNQYYFIRAGEKGEFWKEFKTNNFVAVDYLDQDNPNSAGDFDLSDLTKDEITKRKGNADDVTELFNISQIKKGDIIAVVNDLKTVEEFAVVTSNYYYKNSVNENKHRVDVEYLNFGTSEIGNGAQKGIMRDAQNKIKDFLTGDDSEYFLLRHNVDGTWKDDLGKKYHFGRTVPNQIKLREAGSGTKTIWFTKQSGEFYFWGHGSVKEVETIQDNVEWNLTYDNFKYFEEYGDSITARGKFLKKANKSIKQQIEHLPRYNPQTSMFTITKKIYQQIIGEDLIPNDQVSYTLTDYSRTIDILKRKKNIILYGPPGTGKTFTAKEIAKQMNGVTKSVTFHQSYGYEEFIEGIRPQSTGNAITYPVKPGVFKKFCQSLPRMSWKQAALYVLNEQNTSLYYKEITKISIELEIEPIHHPLPSGVSRKTPWNTQLREMSEDIRINNQDSIFKKSLDDNGKEISGMYELNKESSKYENEIIELESLQNNDLEIPKIFIIDEINRGNISKIFGELITIIENDKRGTEVTLAYSGEQFSVPSNVYIVGTMNTADQSLTHIDAALKRRFSSIEIMPDSSILKKGMKGLPELLDKINEIIREKISRDNQIGHSYFMQDGKPITEIKELQFVFATDIIPLLRDYFYDSDDDLKEVLGEQFIDWNEGSNRNVMEDWQNNPETFRIAIKKAYDVTI